MALRNVCIKYEFNARVQTHADVSVTGVFDQEYDREEGAAFVPPPKPFCQEGGAFVRRVDSRREAETVDVHRWE